MCTVTVVKHEAGYVLTSNRDETSERAALPPEVFEINGSRLMFPRDKTAQGSWIAFREDGCSLCLLNGAHERHKRNPPYRLSRGQLLIQLLAAADPLKLWHEITLNEIEPFTLVMLGAENTLHVAVWDEHVKDLRKVQDPSIILSSSTLYEHNVRMERQRVFEQFMTSQPVPGPDQLMQFHQSSYTGDKTQDFLMQRGDFLRTLSTTQIVYDRNSMALMRHRDYVNNKESLLSFLSSEKN